MLHRLLAVVDDAGITEMVRLAAEQLDIDYRIVTDAEAGRRQYIEYRPAVVIVSEKDCADMIDEINASGIPTKIVMISGGCSSGLEVSENITTSQTIQVATCSDQPLEQNELMAFLLELLGCH